MDLIAAFVIVYLGAFAAAICWFIAAIMLRTERPMRAKGFLWLWLVPLACFVISLNVPGFTEHGARINNWLALIFAASGLALFMLALSLLIPFPKKSRAGGLLIAGFAFAAASLSMIALLSQVNFGL